MNTRTNTLLATLAVALAPVGHAQTVIHIAASGGDRAPVQTAISNLLAAGWTFQGINGSTSSTTSGAVSLATKTNFGAWRGTYAGNPVVVKISFAGALAAVSALAGNVDQRFVVTDGSGSGAVPNPLNGTNLGVDYELAQADFGFSTCFQSTSPFNGVFQGVTYSPLIEETVAITPTAFYASVGFPTASANLTTQQAQLLYSSGSISLAQFTGDFANDGNKIVYAIGRNTDAATRFSVPAEFNLGANVVVKTWLPAITGQTTAAGITYGGTATSQQLWPAETVSGIYSPLGNGGYNSGPGLASVLTAALGVNAYKCQYLDEDTGTVQFLYPDATAGYYIGYLPLNDGNTGVTGTGVPLANRGVPLSYNGVPLTTANLCNGKYTAWLYSRMDRRQSGLAGLPLTFANSLRDQIRNSDAVAGGNLKNDAGFFVMRSTDGGLVVPK